MGFSIFARGTSGFVYRESNCPYQDALTMGNALFRANRVNSTSARLTRGAIRAIGRMQALHLLDIGISLLATNRTRRSGYIDINLESERLLWVNDRTHHRISLRSIRSGSDFISELLPILTELDMNNFGVILEIAKAINLYEYEIRGNTIPRLLISITD